MAAKARTESQDTRRAGRPPARAPIVSERWAWAILLLICLPALLPTLRPGWFEGHDDLHIYRVIEYDLALRDGQVPPRWFPDVSAGYGNPHPLYYAPLFYAIAEGFHLVGLGVIGSLKGAIVVVMLLAAAGMYLYARLLLDPPSALVAAAAYTYAPYHLLDLYVRKAFSELTVFAVLPFLLLSFHRLATRRQRGDIVTTAVCMAAMSTAHTITTMMIPALLLACAVLLSWRRPLPAGAPASARWSWLGRAGVALALGYALAGFFLVPAFLERNEINLKIYTEAYVDYHKHFVFPRQLIWWPWGFGMSLEGLKDKMSFRMGLLQIAGTLLALAGISSLGRRDRPLAAHVWFYGGVTLVAAFMMTPAAAPIWDALPPLKFVQFPWRFLTLTTLSTGFLCGAAWSAWGPRATRAAWAGAVCVAAVCAVAAAATGMLDVNLRVPADRVGFEEKPYNQMIDKGPGAEKEAFDGAFVRRHTFRWIDHLPPEVSFMGLTQADLDRPEVEVVSGDAAISGLLVRSWKVAFHTEAAVPARLRVNNYRFPGWVARVDGAPVTLVEEPRQRRVLFFDIPAGSHDVVVVLETTWPRRLGDLLTLAGLAGVAALALWPQSARATAAF